MPETELQVKNWIEIALKYRGKTYIEYRGPNLGNEPLNGFDCSGYVQFVMKEAGVPLPINPATGKEIRHTDEFFDLFGIFIQEQALQRGDFIFVSRNGVKPTHIAIYLGDERVIHATGRETGKVYLSDLERLRQRPIIFDPTKNEQQLYFSNPIGFKRPSIRIGRYQKVLELDNL